MDFSSRWRRALVWPALLLAWLAWRFEARANPTGGTVTQGTATITGSGSTLNINQTSSGAWINWQTFNVGQGETLNFNQPSATSVTWNQINDVNPSTILGNVNANGYVILQNANGFVVGGNATINAHGLVMTTGSTPPMNLANGGPWSFSAPPPTAKIINYGQINITGGGTAYLIASDIENNGTIFAPGGNIGLYAGENVLVSARPDGRGLSAQVTLPQGSVDNAGNLIASAGSIMAQAQTVNQSGLIQANSVQDVNGTIELVASGNLNLAGTSQISANGDSTSSSVSPGGFVVLNAAGTGTYSDTAGSTISVAGNSAGGQNGVVEFFGNGLVSANINSTVSAHLAELYNPLNIDISANATHGSRGTVNFNVNDLSAFSDIDLWANNNIEVQTLWTLAGGTSPSTLSLSAGNDITIDNGAGIEAGFMTGTELPQDWTINLNAGTTTTPQASITPGNFGVYLNGNAVLQTASGDINVFAANEVVLGTGAIRTIGGGNINVDALYGGVNSGTSIYGLNYYAKGTGTSTAPYYTPFLVTGPSSSSEFINFYQSNLGGISTAAGGNVNITAGGDVTSFPTYFGTGYSSSEEVSIGSANYYEDPGTGCFGSQPGNVTIVAGGNVTGNFMLINGSGTITAGGNMGTPYGSTSEIALSMANGNWNLNAQGNIYLQEVRNPNGDFNSSTTLHLGSAVPTAGFHLFDYSPSASVSLTAGDGVYITGDNLPRPNGAVPVILPPTVDIYAGAGGVNFYTPNGSDGVTAQDIDLIPTYKTGYYAAYTLFPSVDGNLVIDTIGSLIPDDGTTISLYMSDSAQTRWFDTGNIAQASLFGTAQPFVVGDDSSTPAELNNTTPASIDVGGNMDNMNLILSKFATINVGGNMDQCSYYGENLQANQTTTINVGGNIDNIGSFNSIVLTEPIAALAFDDVPQGTSYQWDTPLTLALTSTALSATFATPQEAAQMLANPNLGYQLLGSLSLSGLTYDPTTKTMIAIGPLSPALADMLTETLYVPRYNAQGLPELNSSGHLVTDAIQMVNHVDANLVINTTGQPSLVSQSQNAPQLGSDSGNYILAGTGNFNVTANSINLGNSDGILTVGNGSVAGRNYSFLTPYITSGANIAVTIIGTDPSPAQLSLEMDASTIAALGGGSVLVDSENGSMNLGSQLLEGFENQIMTLNGEIGLGIYTTGGGNVTVTAQGNINVDSSRIATFNGGDINVTSLAGNVDAGSGGNVLVPIQVFSSSYKVPYDPVEYSFADGIVAETLLPGSGEPGVNVIPGNITVSTPQGNISADVGGILQLELDGSLPSGPTVTLDAGTPNPAGDWSSKATPTYVGNIDLGNSGVIGGNVIANATGKISGLLIAAYDLNVVSVQIGNVTAIGGHNVNLSAQSGTGSSTLIGPAVDTSGISSANLNIQSQNASANGSASKSSYAPTTTTATSQSAAQQASQSSAQEVAGNTFGYDTGDNKKKTKIHVSRVTVLLANATPTH